MSAVATPHAPTVSARNPRLESFQTSNLGPVFFGLMVAAALSAVAFIAGIFIWPLKQVLFSLLFGFSFCFTVSAGFLFWNIVHYATDAEWSVVVRRIIEAGAQSLRYVWVFFIPLLIFAPEVYAWMDIGPGKDVLLDGKRAMMNRPFWTIRFFIIFPLLALIAWKLRKNSQVQDIDGDPRPTISSRKWAFAGLPIFAIGLTFGAIDWLKSLDHTWSSTMWGVYIFAGSAWSGMAALLLITITLKSHGYLQGVVNEEHYHIMGKLILAFTVFWAYIGFGQYFLIWYANIPEETSYFIRRNAEGWNILSTALVVGHFFIPFVLLLWQQLKRNPNYMRFICIYVLCIHALDHYIIVLPGLHWAGVSFNLLDLASVVLIGSTLAFFFLKNLAKGNLYPLRDPRLANSLALKN